MNYDHFKIGIPIYYKKYRTILPEGSDPLVELFAKKIYKVAVRRRLVYYVEMDFYEHTVFVKFYPKILEAEPEKFKKVGIGLSTPEIRKLLFTCCKIVFDEMSISPEKVYAFVAQVYAKDNTHKRKKSVRFSVYKKIVTTYFNEEDYIHFNMEAYNFYCITPNKNAPTFIPILQKLVDQVSENNYMINEFVTIAQLQEWDRRLNESI
jgi:hypothetical protein